MKRFVPILMFLTIAGTEVLAAGVRMERLEDFDCETHALHVNVQASTIPGCEIDEDEMTRTLETLLENFGFRTATQKKANLEFAVSIKEQPAAGSRPCGVLYRSMVRQIPRIKMLRVSPSSDSTEYRLWTVEHLITTTREGLTQTVAEEARKDIVSFVREYESRKSQ
jgi:hypothetical protein